MDCHQGEKHNFPVMTKILLLPCRVTTDGAKTMVPRKKRKRPSYATNGTTA